MRMFRMKGSSIAYVIMALGGLSTGAQAASTVEVLANYSPVRVAIPSQPGQFFYQSPSFLTYRSNVMQGLVQGLNAFGPEGSPTRFQAFDKSVYSVFETTGTPFNSWLGDSAPTGAYANEYGTHVRGSVRVRSDRAFTINDILYTYADDQGFSFSRTFGALGLNFSATFIGETANGDLLDASSDNRLTPIVGLYFFGFTNISVSGRETPEAFAASGRSFEDFYAEIDQLYVGDPYSFRDSYDLMLDGQLIASDALEGDIVERALTPVPEPATWAMAIAGFALTGAAARRARVRGVRFA